MAKDVDSLALCMRAVLCDYMFQLDPTVPPIPFNQEVNQKPKGRYSTFAEPIVDDFDRYYEIFFKEFPK